jgi:CBS domain-containing protein
MTDVDVTSLMTSPVLTVEPETPVDEIADAMLEQGINSIVAIDDACQPIGILTATDFVGIVATGTPKTETTVGDHMTTDIVTTTPAAPIPEIADRMLEHGISHLPVVDTGGVIGIISATDLTEYVAESAVKQPAGQ